MRPAPEQGCGKQTLSARKLFFQWFLYRPRLESPLHFESQNMYQMRMENKMLALGVCFPQPCSSAGRRFSASRSRFQNYRRIVSFPQQKVWWNTLWTGFHWESAFVREIPNLTLRVHLNPRIWKICASWMSVWNISANYVLVPLKFDLNWNIWKPFLKSSPLNFSGQRLGNTSLVVFFRFHSFSLVVTCSELHGYIMQIFVLLWMSS